MLDEREEEAMAIFNTARLRDVLVRGRIAEPEPAAALVDELEEQMDSVLSGYPTMDRLGLVEANLLRVMADLEAKAAEREARQAKHINQTLGIMLAGLALAVGIILGFG
jgi:hypothetical protein